jgi:hypothetical protein
MSSKTRTRIRIGISLLVVLAICAGILFFGGDNRWDILMSFATLSAVIAAIFLDEIRSFYHRPEIDVYVGNDLIDIAHDFDAPVDARWVRGRITNIGDRGVERCRLKLLRVGGQNIQPSKIKNGFLQWQGGIRDSMRLNPDEYWIFDIGTRGLNQNAPVRLCAYFVGGHLLHYALPAPGTYTLTVAVYGDNIESKEQEISLTIGAAGIQIACI